MNLHTCTLRELERRPGRTLLTVLGITLGLATVVAIGLTIHAVRGAYRELFQSVTGGLALEVSAPGQTAFDPAFATDLVTVEGVESVSVRIHAACTVLGRTGSLTAALVGIDSRGSAKDWPVRAGGPLHEGNEALLDAALAATLQLTPGDSFRIWTPTGLADLRLAGIVEGHGRAVGAGGVVVIPLENAQRLFDVPAGEVNSVRISMADGADCEGAFGRKLPAGCPPA